MLIFGSRWSDHDKQRRGGGNIDNDPTQDYYLSRLILGSIRLFCSNLIMDKLVFCPVLIPENKQFRKWRVCHWLPGNLFQFCKLLGSAKPELLRRYFGFALASSVMPRQKETSKSVARSLRFVLVLPPGNQFWIRKRFVLSKLSWWFRFFQPPIAASNQIKFFRTINDINCDKNVQLVC